VKNRKLSSGPLQIVYSVCLLVLLALLAGNVVVMLMAGRVNDNVCKTAAEDAAQVYEVHGSPSELRSAILSAINKNVGGGFFIGNPVLTELKYYTDSSSGNKKAMLLVKTVISVRLPAPFLVFFAQPEQDGRLLLNSRCIVELKSSSLSGSLLPN
jgi:hypothetical protein